MQVGSSTASSPQISHLEVSISAINLKVSLIASALLTVKEVEEASKPLANTSSTFSIDYLSIHQFLFLAKDLVEKSFIDMQALYTNLNMLHEKLESKLKQIEVAIKTNTAASSAYNSSSSLLDSLQAALKCCRQHQNYGGEYLLRKLFVDLVRLHADSSLEEMHKALELEQEHLDSAPFFSDQPGTDQEKYNTHLSNYLFLLARYTGLAIKGQTLSEQFPEVVNHISYYLSQESTSSADTILLKRTLAFLLLRPEWFFYQDFFKAKRLLEEAKQNAESLVLKNKIELELIVLETNQATRFYSDQYPPGSINKNNQDHLVALSRRLEPLLKASSSPSDSLLALATGAKIYEFLAKDSDEPEKRIRQLLKCLSSDLKIGNQFGQRLDFKALQVLANCRFLFCFYACLSFETTQDYLEGQKALSEISQDFWTDQQTKQAASLLKNCLASVKKFPPSRHLTKDNFIILFGFKLMLQGKVCDLNSYAYSQAGKLLTSSCSSKKEFPKSEISIWEECQNKFVNYLFNNDLQGSIKIVSHYLSFKDEVARQALEPYYRKEKWRFQESLKDIKKSDLSHLLTFQVNYQSNSSSEELARQMPLDKKSLADVLQVAISNPFVGYTLARYEQQSFNNILLNLDLFFSLEQGKTVELSVYSNLQWSCLIYEHVKAFLKKNQGELKFRESTSKIMEHYLYFIQGSKIINDVLSPPVGLNKQESDEIRHLSHHLPSLEFCCQLAIETYKYAEHYLANPYDKYYDKFFARADKAIHMQGFASSSKEKKIDCLLTAIDMVMQYQQGIRNRTSFDPVEMKNLTIKLLAYQLMAMRFISDVEQKLRAQEVLLSDIGETFEEIVSTLLPPKPLSKNREELNDIDLAINIIILDKAFHLIMTQKVEAGFKLLEDAHIVILNGRGKQEKSKKVMVNEIIKSNDFVTIQFTDIDLKKIRTGYYREPKIHSDKLNKFPPKDRDSKSLTNEKQSQSVSSSSSAKTTATNTAIVNSSTSSQNEEGIWNSCQSENSLAEKQRILALGKEIERRLLLKKEKKQARVASSSTATTTAVTNASSSSAISASLPCVKKELNSHDMELFNRLFQEKTPQSGVWKDRSFRNDIKMTRNEALKLIRALGGRYDARRGKGSHFVAHLPKIEFNGKDMGGLVNWEEGELMITLTSDEELKYYQIKQLRDILISQGFTPDTVKEKS